MLKTLRQGVRRELGRTPEPSAGRGNSQRLKTATQREHIGFDGHQKITGRQRPILVDPLGLVMAVVVTPADTDDRRGFVEWLSQDCADGVKRLRKRGVDEVYPAE